MSKRRKHRQSEPSNPRCLWQYEEDQLLFRYYPVLGERASDIFPGKSPEAVNLRAKVLGLSKPLPKVGETGAEREEAVVQMLKDIGMLRLLGKIFSCDVEPCLAYSVGFRSGF